MREVLRIENRKLRNRMMSAVQTILDDSSPDSVPLPDDLSDLVEYLFLVWNEGHTHTHTLTLSLTHSHAPPSPLQIVTSSRCVVMGSQRESLLTSLTPSYWPTCPASDTLVGVATVMRGGVSYCCVRCSKVDTLKPPTVAVVRCKDQSIHTFSLKLVKI